MLNGDARPMVHGVGQSVMACLSSDDDAALARALGDRRDSCQAAQGGVVTPLQGIEHFCEQRGEYDPSHSRQGFKDLESCWLRCPDSASVVGTRPALRDSVVLAATLSGGWRKLRSLAIVASRMRAALSGVGAISRD